MAQSSPIDVAALGVLWNVDVAKIRMATENMSTEWGTDLAHLTKEQYVGILLLMTKGALARETATGRVYSFKMLLRVECTVGSEQHRRLCSLANVEQDSKAAQPAAPADSQTFEAFARLEGLAPWATHRTAGCWGRSRLQSTVFFRDVVPNCMNRSGQRSGVCYMHGSVAVLHYAICHHTRLGDHRAVHIPSFLVRQLTGRELWRYVSDVEGGGNSMQFLQKLASPAAPDLVVLSPAELRERGAVARVVKLFKKHGPALISGFSTNDAFRGMTSFRFLAADLSPTDSDGSHAMALVGWRCAGRGDIRFLLQNWWKCKQFIEVSLAYLSSRHASLSWLQEVIKAFPDPSVVRDAPWTEFDFDGPDREAELEF